MWFVSKLKTSGTNTHAILTADSPKELKRAARLLRAEVKNSHRDLIPHLDLNPKKRAQALIKGAIETGEK